MKQNDTVPVIQQSLHGTYSDSFLSILWILQLSHFDVSYSLFLYSNNMTFPYVVLGVVAKVE